MTHEQKRIRGYEAADIIIEELIRDAREKLEPYAKREGKKIDWWKGHFEGLVVAHCFMVYGQFPEQPENAKKIEEAIQRELKRIEELTK